MINRSPSLRYYDRRNYYNDGTRRSINGGRVSSRSGNIGSGRRPSSTFSGGSGIRSYGGGSGTRSGGGSFGSGMRSGGSHGGGRIGGGRR